MSKTYRQHAIEKNPDVYRESQAHYRATHTEICKAQVYASRYAKAKSYCEQCDSTAKLEKHHPDYTKPLTVVTLCKICHEDWHKHNEPIGKVEDMIRYLANRHCDNCNKIWPNCGRYRSSRKGRSCCRWEPSDTEKQKVSSKKVAENSSYEMKP